MLLWFAAEASVENKCSNPSLPISIPPSTPCLESTSLQLPPTVAKIKRLWEGGPSCGLPRVGSSFVHSHVSTCSLLTLQERKDDGTHQHKGNTKVNKTSPEYNVTKVQVQNLKQSRLCQPRLATKPQRRSVFSFLLIRKQISRKDKVLADKKIIKAEMRATHSIGNVHLFQGNILVL